MNNYDYKIKKSEIKTKLKRFKSLTEKNYIKEFIFCILTPQSNAQKCWSAVEQIFKLKNITEESIRDILKTKTRFHNNKSKYVMNCFKNWNKIKKELEKENIQELRNWLSNNVQGYGLKEASHFLRNIGKSKNKIAILDRHILKNLNENKIIREPKIRTKKDYFEIEKKFLEYAKSLKIPADELDMLWWSKENGEIFK